MAVPPGLSYIFLIGNCVGGEGSDEKKTFLLREFLLPQEFLWILTPALSPLSWVSGYWSHPFSSDPSDEALFTHVMKPARDTNSEPGLPVI